MHHPIRTQHDFTGHGNLGNSGLVNRHRKAHSGRRHLNLSCHQACTDSEPHINTSGSHDRRHRYKVRSIDIFTIGLKLSHYGVILLYKVTFKRFTIGFTVAQKQCSEGQSHHQTRMVESCTLTLLDVTDAPCSQYQVSLNLFGILLRYARVLSLLHQECTNVKVIRNE